MWRLRTGAAQLNGRGEASRGCSTCLNALTQCSAAAMSIDGYIDTADRRKSRVSKNGGRCRPRPSRPVACGHERVLVGAETLATTNPRLLVSAPSAEQTSASPAGLRTSPIKVDRHQSRELDPCAHLRHRRTPRKLSMPTDGSGGAGETVGTGAPTVDRRRVGRFEMCRISEDCAGGARRRQAADDRGGREGPHHRFLPRPHCGRACTWCVGAFLVGDSGRQRFVGDGASGEPTALRDAGEVRRFGERRTLRYAAPTVFDQG